MCKRRLIGVLPSLPEADKRSGKPLRLEPVWRVKVMALLKPLKGKIRKGARESVCHTFVVVRVALTPKREVDRLAE